MNVHRSSVVGAGNGTVSYYGNIVGSGIIPQLLADLDSDQFTVRDAATAHRARMTGWSFSPTA